MNWFEKIMWTIGLGMSFVPMMVMAILIPMMLMCFGEEDIMDKSWDVIESFMNTAKSRWGEIWK